MNLLGRKYRINPETLRYERVTLAPKRRILFGVGFSVGLFALSVFLRSGFEQYYSAPRQIIYERENAQLRQDYQALNEKLYQVESQLGELRYRDDRLYRSILNLDPISNTIRGAGTGGSERLLNMGTVRDPGMIRTVDQRINKLSSKVRIQSSSLEQVYQEAVNNQRFLACRPSIHPLCPGDPYWMTSDYGYRDDPFNGRRTAHHGIDLAGPHGLDIHSTGDGVVTEIHRRRFGYGNEVVVDHGFGYRTRYAHLQEIHVRQGQQLKRGEVLGKLGSSGRSTGPHLHYEVLKNGHPVNPMYFFYENLDASEYRLLASKASSSQGAVLSSQK